MFNIMSGLSAWGVCVKHDSTPCMFGIVRIDIKHDSKSCLLIRQVKV